MLKRNSNIFQKVLVCLVLVVMASSHLQSQSVATALTIGEFLKSAQQFVSNLESSARSLLDQGNNVAAQQQMLLAGTLQGTITQLQKAYAGSLDKTFDKIDVAQGNAFKQLQIAMQDASKLENRTAQDLNQTVKNTQDAANQLMDRMPLTDKSPVYFGVQTRDVLSSFDPNPNDITITGYHLVDKRLNNRLPTIEIAVNGKTYKIPADRMTAQFNRIDISLPDDLRRAIRIDNQPCDPMHLFHLAGTTYYEGGFFNTSQQFDFSANLNPGARLYNIKVITDGSRTAPTPVQSTFSNTSGEVQVGCNHSASTTVTWSGPEGAGQITPGWAWVETDKLKAQTANAVTTGTSASATGTITGLDEQCAGPFCNCPGGGHGKLNVSGTYVTTQTVTSPFHDEREVTHVNPTHISIPSETILKLSSVDFQITRKGCTQVLDTVHISVPPDANRIIQADSTNGFFEVTLQPGQADVVTTKNAPNVDTQIATGNR